ncbi:hypothetical protein [Nevskia ramosa]|uniref:hypothetical protein n=1 Tax=Nevskia ramosa TaxID=64002 RepID=UPI0023564902|nr:hypothetical protein [Nevskia ramosa]
MSFDGKQLTPSMQITDGPDWDQFSYMAHNAAHRSQGCIVYDFPVPDHPGLTCIGVVCGSLSAVNAESDDWGLPRGEQGHHNGQLMVYWPQACGTEAIDLPSINELLRD